MLKKLILTLFILHSPCIILNSTVHAAGKLPDTGQTKCYDPSGSTTNEIPCAGTGQDGDKLMGVAWPNPRFTDNADGTMTDNLTGLIWLKNANCSATLGGVAKTTTLTADNALVWTNNLASGSCGLTDGSIAGQWRLPNINELASLLDLSQSNPALPSGHPFTSVQNGASDMYWASTTFFANPARGWSVYMYDGVVSNGANKSSSLYSVWPVRGGQ